MEMRKNNEKGYITYRGIIWNWSSNSQIIS